MTPMQKLRSILSHLGYPFATAFLPDLTPAQAEARIIAWKRWAKGQPAGAEPPAGSGIKDAAAMRQH